jgi:hypothetical protein
MFLDQRVDSPQLVCREPEVPCECDGPQPEFCRQVVAVNVDVRRLIRFMAEEVHAIGSTPQDRRHSRILPQRRPPAERRFQPRRFLASAGKPLFGSSLRMPGGVERKVGDETGSGEKNDCNNDSHGYSSSNFAMLASIR